LVVDSNGNTTDTITYDSFGNIASESSPTNGDRFKFTGREWDGEIGQYGYRAREFDPRTGRFDSEDPIGFGGGDGNLYRYVRNAPTNATDPTGLQEGEDKPYDKKNYIVYVVKTDAAGTKLVIYNFLGQYFFGVIYVKGKAPEIFGKCRVVPALNVQIPYYEKDNFTKPYVKIIWINVKATSEENQKTVLKALGTAVVRFQNGGDELLKIVNFIIDREVKKGCLLKEERTDYEWNPIVAGKKTWPKGEKMPPIPPEGDIDKIEKPPKQP
jgi:RHS repeat-associated protein